MLQNSTIADLFKKVRDEVKVGNDESFSLIHQGAYDNEIIMDLSMYACKRSYVYAHMQLYTHMYTKHVCIHIHRYKKISTFYLGIKLFSFYIGIICAMSKVNKHVCTHLVYSI